jgi:hypothetical protein
MAWTDKATHLQVGALYNLGQWAVPTAELKDALKWFEQNATRRQAFDELGRIRGLYIKRNLDREAFFKNPIWNEYFNSKVKGE